MEVIFQKGTIFENSPKTVKGVDYTIISTDRGTICLVIKTLDAGNILVVKPEDQDFEATLSLLGLTKNQTNVEVLNI